MPVTSTLARHASVVGVDISSVEAGLARNRVPCDSPGGWWWIGGAGHPVRWTVWNERLGG